MLKTDFQFGIDVFINKQRHTQRRLALVTNDAATTSGLMLSRQALLKAGFNLVKLFSPEHGISAQGEDGAFQKHQTDTITELPVISLYGDKLCPDEQDFADIDVVLFDLPDVGCRFYTYQWTLSYIMEACSNYHKPLIVLDRPNPCTGDLSSAEGPMLNDRCTSFIGRWNIPLKHHCTIGELALHWQRERLPNLQLEVIPVIGWKRNDRYPAIPVPFVPTSPGIPDNTTVALYPGMGLLEGINVSEGRGTTLPFKVCGAPWINSTILSTLFNELQLTGVKAMPYSFVPTWGKYANEQCHGIMLHVTDIALLKPVQMGLLLLNILANEYPSQIQQHLYITRANPSGGDHLDKLTGVPDSFKWIKEDRKIFINGLQKKTDCSRWREIMKEDLLYE